MKIFITGGTGFIGTHFVQLLLKKLRKSDTVFLLTRRNAEFEDARVNCLLGDLEKIEKYCKELLLSDYIFHIAAKAVFGSKGDYDNVNFIPTKKIVNILTKSKTLRNFIFISSICAIDRNFFDTCDGPLTVENHHNPRSKYGKSKLKAEQYIINSGCLYTIIRPTMVYGRNMRKDSHINKFVSMVTLKRFMTKINFSGKISLIHVEDLAEALVNCINNNKIINKIYFAETGSKSIGKIFRIIHNNIYDFNLKQFNIINLKFIVSRIHGWLPVFISNLFIDYLTAMSPEFIEDFGLKKIRRLDDRIKDVVETNVEAKRLISYNQSDRSGME